MNRSRFVGVGVWCCLAWTALAAGTDADLFLSKQSSPATVELDSLIHYTLVISNAGPAAANNVFLSDPFPLGMFPNSIVVTPANSGTCTFNGSTSAVECDFGTLLVAEFRRVDIDARAPFTGAITNVAVVSANTIDPTTNNNSAIATNLIVILPADISINSSANAAFAQTNQGVTFTINASNAGPGKAFSIQVQNVFPPSFFLTNVSVSAATSYSTNNNLWTIPSLASNVTATLLLTGYRTNTGTGTNTTYIASASNQDPNRTNNTNRVSITWVTGPSADLELSARGPTNVLRFTDPATITITLSNRGPNLSSNVSVQVLSWIGFEYSNHIAAPSQIGFDAATRRWTIGNFAQGTSYDLQLFLRRTNSGTATLIAEVFSSSLPDPDSAPNNVVSNEDDQVSVNVAAARTYNLSGVIQDGAGAPFFVTNMFFDVEGTNLLGVASYPLDAFNAWTVTNLLAGTYTVTPRKNGHTFSPTSRTLTIISSDVGGAIFAVVQVLPELKEKRSGSNLLLSWPVSATNYNLQGAHHITGPWTNVTATPSTNAGVIQVQLPAVTNWGMFRLIKP